MELILKQDIENLGFKDEIVIVKNGYGRNFLIPTGKAVLATESAKKQKISDAVRRANARLSGFERVRHFLILNEDFTIENSMLTPTLKVRRHIISNVYKGKLNALYKSGKK